MPVDRIKELVQEGLRRKLSGDLQGAADAWQEALLLDPANERARAGLESLAQLGLQAPSDPLKPGVTPAMGLLFTPPSVVVQNSPVRKNPFARPDRFERAAQPVPLTPSPFEATRTPLSLLVRDGIEAGAPEEPPRPASSQTLVFGFTPPEDAPKAATPPPARQAPSPPVRPPPNAPWIDISEALGAIEEIASGTMGSLFFGEASGPQTQIYGVPGGVSEPIREFLRSAQEPGASGMTKVQFLSPAREPLPPSGEREKVPLPPPAPAKASAMPGPVPLPPPSPPGATPLQFPVPQASSEAPTLVGFPGPDAAPEPVVEALDFEERFPHFQPPAPAQSSDPAPDRRPVAPESPELAAESPELAAESPELGPDSPFPMTPRPFTVNLPTPPGGTMQQFVASLPPEAAASPSPFPRTPRPFPIEPAASGGTRVQFPGASGRRGEAPPAGREPVAPPPAPFEATPASPTARGLSAEPAEAERPLEIEIEVDLGPSPEESPAQGPDIGDLLLRAADQLALDDHTGALRLVEEVLAIDPQNATAHELLQRCESTLLAMFESKLGDLSYRPQVKLKPDEIVWLNLDHRAGFVLSMVDGQISYDDLFTLSSMSRLDTARILVHLLQARAIG